MRLPDKLRLKRGLQDPKQNLPAMNNTPIATLDATFYAHDAEQLRIVLKESLTLCPPARVRVPVQVWPPPNCAEHVGCHDTETATREARADFQRWPPRDYGPDTILLKSITITFVVVSRTRVIDRPRQR